MQYELLIYSYKVRINVHARITQNTLQDSPIRKAAAWGSLAVPGSSTPQQKKKQRAACKIKRQGKAEKEIPLHDGLLALLTTEKDSP